MDREEAQSVREGDVLGGRYRVDALIGEGGYGRVYRATQLPLGREVAIKLVAAVDDEGRARFAREAAIAQRLEHPNTVRLYDHGISPGGWPFLVLELLRGTSVYDLIRSQGSLSPRVALEITAQVLKSLAEAHQLGIVHRDIKPENVFVTSHFGQAVFVKVLDFGIATQVRGGKKLTAVGAAVGTPSYMAPEQTLGGSIDPRTDLYAVGLLLAEMITGRQVMGTGGAITIMTAQATSLPVPLSDDLRQSIVGPLVERAVQKLPQDRFQTAGEMLAAVEATMHDVNATSAARTHHGAPASEPGSPPAAPPATLQGAPGHLTIASQGAPEPSRPSGVDPAGRTELGTTSSPFAERAPQLTQATPPHQAPPRQPFYPGPAAEPPPRIAAPPQKSRGTSSPLLPGVAIAAIGLLVVAVVVLVVRDVRRDDRREDRADRRGPAPVAPVEENLDHPRARRARTADVAQVRQLLLGAGYQLLSDSASGTTHTFAIQRAPCTGSVTIMQMANELQARRAAKTTAEHAAANGVLYEGRHLFSLGLVRSGGNGLDPGCTEAVVGLLAR